MPRPNIEPPNDAVAPYNFVPLPEKVLKGEPLSDQGQYDSTRHTGWFDVIYRTLTPTYTRAARGVDADYVAPVTDDGDGQPADFFHYGDMERKPVLPGSSLRGMVRNVFEILTGSRMNFVNNRREFYRSFAAPKESGLREFYAEQFAPEDHLVAGLLVGRKGNRKLRISKDAKRGFVALAASDRGLLPQNQYPAPPKARNNRRDKGILSGTVYLKITGITELLREKSAFQVDFAELCSSSTPGALRGRIAFPCADVGSRACYQVILEPDNGRGYEELDVPDSTFDDYEDWRGRVSSSWDKSRGTPRDIAKEPEPYAFALWEKNESGTKSCRTIGASLMPVLRYKKTIHDLLPQATSPEDFDMTEAVFGCVRGSGKAAQQIRGRVFFEDAHRPKKDDPEPWLDGTPERSVRVPNNLLGPKTTATQMYLRQTDWDKKTHYDTKGATLRGFKRYWHRSAEAAEDELFPDDRPLGTTETRIVLIRSDCRFLGRVRFENLSGVELGALYAALRLPNGLAHKFGMGKSLGLGSLKVSVKAHILRMETRYETFSSNQRTEDEVEAILEEAYSTFARAVAGAKTTTLWQVPRLRILAKLLAQSEEIRPHDDLSRAVGVDEKDSRGEPTRQSLQWSRRVPLPELRGIDVEDLFEVTPDADEEKRAVPQAGSRLPATVHNVSQPMRKWLGDITLVGIERKPFGKQILDKEYAEGEEITIEVVIAEPNGYIQMIHIVPNP